MSRHRFIEAKDDAYNRETHRVEARLTRQGKAYQTGLSK